MSALITAEWLAEIGFRWSQFDRQPDKQWTLWLGGVIEDGMFAGIEDLGVELAPAHGRDGQWHCWLRADYGRRYGRFLHVRLLRTAEELGALITGLIGQPFVADNVIYGALQTFERAERYRAERDRLDRRLLASGPAWHPSERDPTLDGARAEHLQAFEDRRGG